MPNASDQVNSACPPTRLDSACWHTDTVQKITINGPDYAKIQDEGHYEVKLKDFTLDFYFRPSESKAAYIFSPGWINRETYPYPYFQRMKWLADLDGVGISLADPTQRLADDVQIGWFIGTTAADYAKITAAFMGGLLRHLGIQPSQTLFFGSSAGGFASLAMATHLRGAKALAVNPQTEILRFHDVGELARTLRASFGGMSSIKIEATMPWRVSIAELWKKEEHVPAATVMINTHDHWHMQHHLAPLVAGLTRADAAAGVSIRFFSNEEAGHNPPPAHRLVPVMKELMAS